MAGEMSRTGGPNPPTGEDARYVHVRRKFFVCAAGQLWGGLAHCTTAAAGSPSVPAPVVPCVVHPMVTGCVEHQFNRPPAAPHKLRVHKKLRGAGGQACTCFDGLQALPMTHRHTPTCRCTSLFMSPAHPPVQPVTSPAHPCTAQSIPPLHSPHLIDCVEAAVQRVHIWWAEGGHGQVEQPRELQARGGGRRRTATQLSFPAAARHGHRQPAPRAVGRNLT